MRFIDDVPSDIDGIVLFKNKSVQGNDMFEMHSHTYHELYFLLSGERRYFIGHEIYDVEPGNVVMIPSDTLHRTTSPAKRGYDRYVLYFNEKDIEGFITEIGKDEFDKFMEKGCLNLPKEYSEIIRHCFESIEDEQDKCNLLSRSMMRNILENIILLSMRHGEKKRRGHSEGEDKIEEIAKYISVNYKKEITLTDAATMAYMEETYFSKKFKNLTGFGFKEYLIYTRIKAAQKMLTESDASITEISESCGFTSSNYFGDVFKHYVGMSPSKYRKSIYHGTKPRIPESSNNI